MQDQITAADVSAPSFRSDERGAVAILMAFLIIVMCLMAGLAVDMGRILIARSALASASDAAGLAVGRALMEGRTVAEAKKIGEAFFANNIQAVQRSGATVPTPKIVADSKTQQVTVDAAVTVPMSLMRIGGFKEMAVPVRSQVKFATKDVEVGVAIDVTGSMGQSIAGQTKISSLKVAFSNFVDMMIPDEGVVGRKVRIGVAPYAASINLGTFAGNASNYESTDNCVTERIANVYTDQAPGPGRYFATKKDGTTDVDNTQGPHGYGCTNAKIMPLSGSREDLKKHVNAFNVGGTTGGHFGTQWAWNLVSENYQAFWGGSGAPDTYAKVGEDKLIKAVILMTDGIYNVAYRHGKAREQAIKLCDAMKAQGIIVFSVGFGLGNDPDSLVAKNTLEKCANPNTLDKTFYVDAANGAQLDAAFKQFAAVLGKLRVSK